MDKTVEQMVKDIRAVDDLRREIKEELKKEYVMHIVSVDNILSESIIFEEQMADDNFSTEIIIKIQINGRPLTIRINKDRAMNEKDIKNTISDTISSEILRALSYKLSSLLKNKYSTTPNRS